MRKNRILSTTIILVAMLVLSAFTLDLPAYKIFNKKSKSTKYSKLLKQAEDADVVLFGELHNNPISHWLQLQLTKDLFKKHGNNLVQGAEMFERDNQIIMTEYLNGMISKSNFKNQSRLWPNYNTDYQDLVEFAKKNELNFIATNVPRRYASIVSKKGFEGLNEIDDKAKEFIAPLPIPYDGELKSYKAMENMFKGHGAMGPRSKNMPKAQALKDATMAHSIIENLKENQKFIHYHGTYHSNDFEGIYWYLKKYKPELKILTIASVEQSQLDSLESDNQKIADFILCIPNDMTKTH